MPHQRGAGEGQACSASRSRTRRHGLLSLLKQNIVQGEAAPSTWDGLVPFSRAQLASATSVGQASRLPGRAKRSLGGAKAAPFGAVGQARRLPYFPGTTSTVLVLPRCVAFSPPVQVNNPVEKHANGL